MKDIHDKRIKIGDTVKTTQPSGGVFNSAPSSTGVVENYETSFGGTKLCIRYRKENQNFDRFILLDGKINEILN